MKIHVANNDIALVSIYAPNALNKEFYQKVPNVLSGFKCINGTDFNAVLDHSFDRSGQSENLEQRQASESLHS